MNLRQGFYMRNALILIACFVLGCPVIEEETVADLGPLESDASTTDAADTAVSADTGADGADAADAAADTATDAATTDGATDAAADVADAGCMEESERGAWMYRHPGNPLGTDAIVGVPAEETTAITNLQTAQITRIYGNYGDRPTTDTAAIAAWNADLDAAGIESQLLLGDGDDIFPGCQDDLLDRIQTRLIDFNAAVGPTERFTALHLDVEPQQYKQGAAWPTTTSCGLRIQDWMFWDDLDDGERAQRYEMLRQTFGAVRDYLDANGHATTPLYVDLAPWIDSSASFDWSAVAGVADGDDWLAQVATDVTGMTLMTYERDTAGLIDSAASSEATLATELRVSVNARERTPLSSTTTWADLNAMWAVVETLEQTHCGDRPVDLFNYRYLHE